MSDENLNEDQLPVENHDEKQENARKDPSMDSEPDGEPGLLGAATHKHEFCVLNVSTKPLKGSVSWIAGGNKVSINVNNLQPCAVSARKEFSPMSLHRDQWHWSEKGRKYQLNCYKKDRFAVVVISDYGLSVIVTATAPDKWKW